MRTSSWTVVEPSLPALTYTYVFGCGIANADHLRAKLRGGGGLTHVGRAGNRGG